MKTEAVKPNLSVGTNTNLIIVKATYTVNKEFVTPNQQNVKAFIADLKMREDIRYVAFLGTDGQTFTHLAFSKSPEAQRELLSLPSFVEFQKQRDANLIGIPALASLTLLDSSFEL